MEFGKVPLKRGLRKFINDVRACQSKEAEEARVQKELANVRQKFSGAKQLKSYDRKKYVWKLVYIFMLGYEVEFGHIEAVNLASSSVAAEKYVGYLALGVLLGSNSDLARLVINTVRLDLQSADLFAQSLALNLIGNIGGAELADSLAGQVSRILENDETHPQVRKKAALCICSFARARPAVAMPQDLLPHVQPMIDSTYQLGQTLSVLTLVTRLAEREPAPFAECVGDVVRLLDKVVVAQTIPKGYFYHNIPCPFIQVRAFKFLQLFPFPSALSQSEVAEMLVGVLKSVFGEADKVCETAQRNARFATLVEAVNLVTHYGDTLPSSSAQLIEAAVRHLATLILLPDSNVRYQGLASMSRLAQAAQRDGLESVLHSIRSYQDTVKASLRDSDNSIRKKALDLLFSTCDREHATTVVSELLAYLETVSFEMKPETVLKIAILAERHATDFRWYLDTILHLIAVAGDHVSDDIWHRAIQIVTNREELQFYAARKMYDALQPSHVHETSVKVGAYILGEFGYLLVEPNVAVQGPDFAPVAPLQLFEAVNQHLANVTDATRSLLFHAYAKIAHLYEAELLEEVSLLLDAFRDAADPELQQRACEYFVLLQLPKAKREASLESMPPFPSDRISAVVRALEARSAPRAQHQPAPASVPVRATAAVAPGGVAASTIARAAASAVGAAPAEEDLLGITGHEPADQATDEDADRTLLSSGLESRPLGPEDRWFGAALAETKGLLFQDDCVQIGVQHQYQGAQGKIILFLGNRTPAPLFGVSASVPSSAALVVQAGTVESSIGPRSQARVQVVVTCMSPFEDSPSLAITFTAPTGEPRTIKLRLPVSVCSFGQPVRFDADEFNSRWQALLGKPQESFALPGLGVAAVDRVMRALSGLRFAADKSEDFSTITAATTVRTATVNVATQQAAVVGCLVRLKILGTSANVYVRSVNASVARGVRAALAAALAP